MNKDKIYLIQLMRQLNSYSKKRHNLIFLKELVLEHSSKKLIKCFRPPPLLIFTASIPKINYCKIF